MTGAVVAAASGGTSALDVVIIVVAISVGAFIKGATGGGLPQVAIPVMAPFIGVEHAVVIMALPGIVSNAWLAYHHREEYPRTRDLPSLVGLSVVGAVVGTVALKSLDGRALSAVLVVVIVAYVVVVLVHPGFHLPARLTRVASPPVGLVGGVLQGSTGISGPLFTTYLHGFQLLPRAYGRGDFRRSPTRPMCASDRPRRSLMSNCGRAYRTSFSTTPNCLRMARSPSPKPTARPSA